MRWLAAHTKSEELASRADTELRSREIAAALESFLLAAKHEEDAFRLLDDSKPRSLGIVAVSATALYLRAQRSSDAERLALDALNRQSLSKSARSQLRQLLQDAWADQDKYESDVKFLPGQVHVAVRGGKVLHGGAPLDLIVDKIKAIQAIFYRTIENIKGEPLRTRGAPRLDIAEACQPWLFQAPPGSYQFTVAVQQPEQKDFFKADIDPSRVVREFLGVLRAGASNDSAELQRLVPRAEYRDAFLKLTRSLAPPSKATTYESIEVRAPGEQMGVILGADARQQINQSLRAGNSARMSTEETTVTVVGVLRGLHLDKDWIEISGSDGNVEISGIKDTLEDLIGPMTNRRVVATARRPKKGKLQLLDIDLE